MYTALSSLVSVPFNILKNNDGPNKTTTPTRAVERGRRRDVAIAGLRYTGKTSLIYKLKTNSCFEFPSTNFILKEVIQIDGVDGSFRCVEGLDLLADTPGVVAFTSRASLVGILFVVDGTNPSSLPQARELLHKIATSQTWTNTCIAVVLNKSDNVRSFAPVSTLVDALELAILNPDRIQVFINTSTDGIGGAAALAWMAEKRENEETLREFSGLFRNGEEKEGKNY